MPANALHIHTHSSCTSANRQPGGRRNRGERGASGAGGASGVFLQKKGVFSAARGSREFTMLLSIIGARLPCVVHTHAHRHIETDKVCAAGHAHLLDAGTCTQRLSSAWHSSTHHHSITHTCSVPALTAGSAATCCMKAATAGGSGAAPAAAGSSSGSSVQYTATCRRAGRHAGSKEGRRAHKCVQQQHSGGGGGGGSVGVGWWVGR